MSRRSSSLTTSYRFDAKWGEEFQNQLEFGPEMAARSQAIRTGTPLFTLVHH